MKRVIQIVCVAVVSLALMPFQVSAETLEIKSHTADGSANLNGVPGQHGDTQACLVAGMSGEPIEPRSAIAPIKSEMAISWHSCETSTTVALKGVIMQ